MITIQRCPECHGQSLDHDYGKGEVICIDCGLVIDDKIIRMEIPTKPEDEGGGRDGVGAPFTNTDPTSGLQTQIGSYSDLRQLPTRQRYRYNRLRMWQNRTNIAIERNLKTALPDIKRLVSQIGQPFKVAEEASRIYREAAFKGKVKGRAIEVVVAAATYAACRSFDAPISLKDIQQAYGIVEKKDIGKTYRMLVRELNLKYTPQIPQDYIPKICTRLNLSQKVQTTSVEFLENCDELLSGKNAMSLASSAVYISSLVHKEKRTQNSIAKASGVTEVTLRNRYKDFVRILGLTPKKIKELQNKNQK